MKRISVFAASIAFFLLAAAVLLTAVDLCSFDRNFYAKEYAADETAMRIGMSDEDLMNSTNALLDYLQKKRDEIVVTAEVDGGEREVFNERETEHMADVRSLYQNALTARNVMAVCGFILLIAACALSRKDFSHVMRRGYQYGLMLMMTLAAMAAFYAFLDFTAFWTNFHELFFNNDLWLLDPNTSIMINMFPENFFSDLVVRILFVTCGVYAVSALAVYQPWRRFAK